VDLGETQCTKNVEDQRRVRAKRQVIAGSLLAVTSTARILTLYSIWIDPTLSFAAGCAVLTSKSRPLCLSFPGCDRIVDSHRYAPSTL
jgi:hypothetical protein